MAKTSAVTGGSGENIHTRTTSDGVESQAVVLAIDGSDSVVPVDATHGVSVEGAVASGDTDSGNPVKVGGRYNAAGVVMTDGDRGDLQLSIDGAARITGAYDTGSGAMISTEIITASGQVLGGEDIGVNHYLFSIAQGNIASGSTDGTSRPVKVGGRFNTTPPTLTDGQRGDIQLDANANAKVAVATLPALPAGTNNIGDVDVLTVPVAGTATLSNVSTSGTSATLLSANSARKGAVIYNDSLVVLYVKFGTTASATSFTYYLAAGAHLELPVSPSLYTGRIDGILASSTGTARVTELT